MGYKKMRPITLGIAFGVTEGLVIFTVTILLVLHGESGHVLLSELFPFHDLSFGGAFIGLVEGLIDGFVGGLVFASVYNFGLRKITGEKE
jgi:hypothetical protein